MEERHQHEFHPIGVCECGCSESVSRCIREYHGGGPHAVGEETEYQEQCRQCGAEWYRTETVMVCDCGVVISEDEAFERLWEQDKVL